jgi:hypothetical protein
MTSTCAAGIPSTRATPSHFHKKLWRQVAGPKFVRKPHHDSDYPAVEGAETVNVRLWPRSRLFAR